MGISQYKSLAKEQLGNKILSETWLSMVVVSCIFICLNAVLGIISCCILIFLFVGIYNYSETKIYAKFARKRLCKPNYREYISGAFDDFYSITILGIVHFITIFLWSLLLIIPGIVKYYSYAEAYYIKIRMPNYDYKMCLDESKRMMQGNKGKLFLLDLSFIGWYLVGALCLGFGVLWVIPYHKTARIMMLRTIYKENKIDVDTEENISDNSNNDSNKVDEEQNLSTSSKADNKKVEDLFAENEDDKPKTTKNRVKKAIASIVKKKENETEESEESLDELSEHGTSYDINID